METKFYQIVVKFNVTNKIMVFDFKHYESYKFMLTKMQNERKCIILTTNIYFKYE